jgi:GNAT superfamily N-acetyltransferase
VRIRPLQQADTKGGFSCGVPALDSYFATFAWRHARDNIARVYVLEDSATRGTILGYYTLAAREIGRDRLQGTLTGSLLRYPLPVLYIGYFAVTHAMQGQGLGRALMGDAFRRCVDGAEHVGAVGVLLDSLDDRSTAFHKRLGFLEIPRDPAAPPTDTRQPMFLKMALLQAARPMSE